MKKPVFLRFLGWFGWLTFASHVACFVAYLRGNHSPAVAVMFILAFLATFALWSVWGIGTCVVWAVNRKAAGEVMGKLAQPAARVAPVVPQAGSPVWYYCTTHELWMDRAEGEAHRIQGCGCSLLSVYSTHRPVGPVRFASSAPQAASATAKG